MTKNPRRRIVAWERRPNTGPSAHIWPWCWASILACGHCHDQGVCEPTWNGGHEQKTAACWKCGAGKPPDVPEAVCIPAKAA